MKKIYNNKNFLNILFGFVVASSTYLYLEYRYEQKTLLAFVESICQNENLNVQDEKAVVLAAMSKTHQLMYRNQNETIHLQLNTLEDAITSPLLKYGLTQDGGCGGNTLVLAQILQGMGYQVRPVQMSIQGTYGGHIILETRINGSWAVLDPMYNVHFTNANGTLASFDQVQHNWNYYKAQLPITYPAAYTYDAAQYTNWSKAGIVGTAAKWTLSTIAGSAYANTFSFRSLILMPKSLLFYFSVFILGFSFIAILNNRYFKIHMPNILWKYRLNKKVVTYP